MIGYCIAARISERTHLLGECVALIKRIKADISYYVDPLPIIVERAGMSDEFAKLTFLSYVSASDNADLPTVWSEAVESFYRDSPLSRVDINYLKAFGKKLGATDSEHQKNLCNEYISIFEERLNKAKSKKNEQVRLCKICAAALGVLELIMLM